VPLKGLFNHPPVLDFEKTSSPKIYVNVLRIMPGPLAPMRIPVLEGYLVPKHTSRYSQFPSLQKPIPTKVQLGFRMLSLWVGEVIKE
jgi:hypothetical protein